MDNSTPDFWDQQIQLYLDGEMEEKERSDFENQLNLDTHLRSRLEDRLLAREAIIQYGIKAQVAEVHRNFKEKRTPVIPHRRKWVFAIAASILLAWISFETIRYFSVSADSVFAAQFNHYELPVLRSEEQKSISELETAYRDKDFNRVVRLCKLNSSPSRREGFLCGMAEMELGNFPDAIRSFESLIQYNITNATREYQDEAEFNLALAFIKTHDFDQALRLLQSIQSDPQHLYHRKVTSRLIARIKRLN